MAHDTDDPSRIQPSLTSSLDVTATDESISSTVASPLETSSSNGQASLVSGLVMTDSSSSTVVSPPETSSSAGLTPTETSSSSLVSPPGTSSSTVPTTPRISSTEGPATATPVMIDMGSSSSQPEIEADAFLESMSAVLSPKLKTQPTQGPSSVREHSMSAPFVSPPGRMNASSSMPTVAEPNTGPPRSGSAKATRMASMPPGTFKAQLAVRGNAPPPMMHGQGFGLGPSIPASEVWNGFVSSQTGAPFAPAPSGSPFGNLQPGGVPGFKPNLAAVPQLVAGNTGHQDAEQKSLGSLTLDTLSDSDVLFYFGTLCAMARLSPQFLFKYGGKNGKQVGVRLLMYGHTILVAAEADTAYMARVVACRRALTETQTYHPEWLVPPLPIHGATGAHWNWVSLLEAFCTEIGWSAPTYNTGILGNLWHSELSVNDFFFRTFQGCGSMDEAQNTVSHHALYQLLATDNIDVGNILPLDSPLLVLPEVKKPVMPPTEEAIRKKTSMLLNAIESLKPYPDEAGQPQALQDTVDALDRLRKDETKPTGKVSGLSGGKIAKQQAKPVKPVHKEAQKKPPTAPGKAKPKNPPAPLPAKPRAPKRRGRGGGPRHGKERLTPPQQSKAKGKEAEVESSGSQSPSKNANMVPLTKSRLAPVEMEYEPIVDQLATLKAVQEGLGALSPHASFLRLMKTMCHILQIEEPEIRYNPAPYDASGPIHTMHAFFNDPNPFLTRASPVFLANVGGIDEEDAYSLGVKKIILFLLKMCKDEVDMDVLESRWEKELEWLSRLEREVKDRLSQSQMEMEM